MQEVDVQSDRNPILQAFFQHIVAGQFGDEDLRVEAAQRGLHIDDFDFGLAPAEAKFEISLQTSTSPSGCCCIRWEFMREVLTAAAICTLDRHLGVMARRLAQASQATELLIAELALAPLDEREALQNCWVSSESEPLPDHLRIEDIFLQQALRTPNQTAVAVDAVDGPRNVSWKALAKASCGMAQVLRQELLACSDSISAKQVVVAVLAHRCAELPVALLAILLVGASFLPLSPENPLERLHFMVVEAGALALLATCKVAAFGVSLAGRSVPPLIFLEVPSINGTSSMAGLETQSIRRCALMRSEAVYVLFTSGSTGRPKGVSLSHKALLSHLLPYIRVLKLQASDRVLLTSSYSFDMAYSQIFGALLSGATLVLTEQNPMVDPSELFAVMQQKSVTFTTIVPSVLSAMVHLNSGALELPSLRHLGCGGEPLASAAADYYKRARTSRTLLHNRYGPTECAINALMFGPSQLQEFCDDAPIGWASAHRHVHLSTGREGVEQDLMTLQMDGEVLLGGPGVALGYVARPELTNAAFNESSRGAGRHYHTGDLVVRSGLRGCLRFLGCRKYPHGKQEAELSAPDILKCVLSYVLLMDDGRIIVIT